MNYPRNQNTGLINQHSLYVGDTGSGKSQAMAQNTIIPKKGNRRIALWDTHSEYEADIRVNSIHELCGHMALLRGKDNFKIAYSGQASQKNFDLFCAAIYRSLDGDMLTYLLVDELASVCAGIAKDRSYSGNLLREGRKYGLVYFATAISTTEIPKTFLKTIPNKYFEKAEDPREIETALDNLFIDKDEYLTLPDNKLNKKGQAETLYFWFKAKRVSAEKIAFKVKKVKLKPI